MDTKAAGFADVHVACDRIRSRLEAGAPWDACDAFAQAQRQFPADGQLLYWGALSHARAGSTRQAQALIDQGLTASEGQTDLRIELTSLRGRLWKDRLQHTRDPARAAAIANLARAEYLAAYALRGDVFPGINAASLTLRAGDETAARELAQQVLEKLDSSPDPHDAWAHASAGEACLLLGRTALALQHYRHALEAGTRGAGSVASMRRQLNMLAAVLPAARDVLAALPLPTVIAFAGPMPDADGQHPPRFPAGLEPALRETLRVRLRQRAAPLVVFSSAACGADLIFIEEALAQGAEVNVVLPFDPAEFRARRVAVGGPSWAGRFDVALQQASRVILATEESHLGDDVLYEHALHLVEGLASLRASQLETKVTPWMVVHPQDAAEPDGLMHTLQRWQGLWGRVDAMDLAELGAQAFAAVPGPPPGTHLSDLSTAIDLPAAPAVRPRRTLKALLFADIAGFGRLHDVHAPLFHATFLDIVHQQIRACPTAPLEANTWGDALYVVFAQPDEGAEFALCLMQRMQGVDWSATGLPAESQIRMALHAGPVFCGFDPIIGRDNYFGSSVTKTARIEPITPPGAIYASEAFAAALASTSLERYGFEYMGELSLAKAYGDLRIYRLERAS